MIDEQRTLEIFGYTSDELSPKSHKSIVKVCDNCGEYKIIEKYAYRDLCHSCSKLGKRKPFTDEHKRKMSKTHKINNKPPKPQFVPESERFLNDTMIDRIETIKRFGYDPINLSRGSKRKIITICKNCGNKRIISRSSYKNLCYKCAMSKTHKNKIVSNETHKKLSDAHKGKNFGFIGENHPNYGKYQSLKTRIKISCYHQGINIENFNGFVKDKPYCDKWTEKLRQSIRDKYNNCDYISGLHKDICNNGRQLDVHHIDYDKDQGCGKDFNLIPLSRSNHVKTNKNRWFWNRLFTYSLEIDKWYYGDYFVN